MRSWVRYLTHRLATTALMLFGVAVVVFYVTRLLGTPVYLLVGNQASDEVIEATIRSLGLDRPILEQFWTWFTGVLSGDLGTSRHTFNAVTSDLALRFPATLELVLAALTVAMTVGIVMGIVAARRPNRGFDRIAELVTQLGASIPNFWIGLVLVYLLAYQFGWFPAPIGRLAAGVVAPPSITGLLTLDSVLAGNWPALASSLRYLMLPALTLSLLAIPAVLQITRGTFIEILASDYIRTARALGLPTTRVYFRYALRNALVPILTTLAMSFGFLMSGTVLIEVVFAWPGLGLYAVNALNAFDYEPIIAVVLISASLYAAAYLVSDLASYAIDPRIAKGRSR